jgi:hypothetical protein
MTSHHTISSITKYTRYHHKAYILSLKKASVSSDILVGHVTSSQNESVLSKYLMVHEKNSTVIIKNEQLLQKDHDIWRWISSS